MHPINIDDLLYFLSLFIPTLIIMIVAWEGARIQIGTTKDDPTKAKFTAELYPLKRLFNIYKK